MTSATDELRKLLDERWVEYGSGFGGDTLWTGRGGIEWRWDKQEGTLAVYSHTITPEQAIAATLGNGTLTAEQVRKAIFDGSSYASYDGAKYYADGIHMQAIADELNAELGSDRETALIQAIEDVLRYSTDTVWVGEIETLVDRMVALGVYGQDVYKGARPWEVKR